MISEIQWTSDVCQAPSVWTAYDHVMRSRLALTLSFDGSFDKAESKELFQMARSHISLIDSNNVVGAQLSSRLVPGAITGLADGENMWSCVCGLDTGRYLLRHCAGLECRVCVCVQQTDGRYYLSDCSNFN